MLTKNPFKIKTPAWRIIAVLLTILSQSSFAVDLDTDQDGTFDLIDNCVQESNSDQRDTNNDGIGIFTKK